jgi:oligopeptide transport system substrate-binding protein
MTVIQNIQNTKLPRRRLLGMFGLSVLGFGGLAACSKGSVAKGTMRVALIGGPDSLDPFEAEFAISALLFRQYLLPVVGYGPNGAASASIAKSWSSTSDFKKWTFEIASGLKWSDNVPLTALDVVKSLQMGADPKVAYPDATELFAIKGYRDAVVNGADPKKIAVSLEGTNKVVVELEGADASFPLRMQEFYPVPMQTIEAHGANWTDIGKIVVSGPFIPTSRTQTRIVFDKNPLGGWNENMPSKIEVETVEDASTRVRMFQSKDVDLAQDPPLLRFADLAREYGPKFERVRAPRFIYMSLNTKRPQFADKDVRRALSMGFDRILIAHNIMRDAVNPATRFIRDLPPIPYDKDGAKAILESKGISVTSPLRFELLVAKNERERAAIQISSMWKEIGVEATIGTVDPSAISTRLNGFDFDAAIVQIDKGMKSDPLDLMASFGSGGNAYSHGWKNPEFDKALVEAAALPAGAARNAAIAKAESYLLDDVPLAPIWFGDSAWLRGERVIGGIEGMAPIIWPNLGIKD